MQPLGLHQPLGSVVALGQREQRFVRSPLGQFTPSIYSPHIQRFPTLGQRLQADSLQRSGQNADIGGLSNSELANLDLSKPELLSPEFSSSGLADLSEADTTSSSVQLSPDSATSLFTEQLNSPEETATGKAFTPESDAIPSWEQLKPLSRPPLANPPKTLTPQSTVPERIQTQVQAQIQAQIQAQPLSRSDFGPSSPRSNIPQPNATDNLETEISKAPDVVSPVIKDSSDTDIQQSPIENIQELQQEPEPQVDRIEPIDLTEPIEQIDPSSTSSLPAVPESIASNFPPQPPQPQLFPEPRSPHTEAPQLATQPQIQLQVKQKAELESKPKSEPVIDNLDNLKVSEVQANSLLTPASIQPESNPEIPETQPTIESQAESQSILSDSPEISSTQPVVQQQTKSDFRTLSESEIVQEQEQLAEATESFKSSTKIDSSQTSLHPTEISSTTTPQAASTHPSLIQPETKRESSAEQQEPLAASDGSLTSSSQASTVESKPEIAPSVQLQESTTDSTDFLTPISSNENFSASEPQELGESLVEPLATFSVERTIAPLSVEQQAPELPNNQIPSSVEQPVLEFESNNQTESIVQSKLERSPLQRNTTRDNNLEPRETSSWSTGDQTSDQVVKETVPQIEAGSSGFTSPHPVEQVPVRQPEIQSVLQAPIQPLNEEPVVINRDSMLQTKNNVEPDKIAALEAKRIQNRFDRLDFQQRQPLGRAQPLATATSIMPKLDRQSIVEAKSPPATIDASSTSDSPFSSPEKTTPTSVATPGAWSSIEDLMGKSGVPSSQPWEQAFNLQSPLSEELVSPIATNMIQAPASQSEVAQSQYTLSNYGANVKQPGTKSKIDDEKLEWLAHIIYGAIRDRLASERERYRYTAATHPPWTDTINPNFFKSTALTSQTNAPDTQQQPLSTRYPPSRPLETLTQEMYKRMQLRLEQDKERRGNNNYKRQFI